MVITFDSSNIAVIAYEILKNRLFDEKKLLGMRDLLYVIYIENNLCFIFSDNAAHN